MASVEFKGWVGHDKNAIGNLKYEQFKPKNWTEDDVEIRIHYSGICASDLHTLSSGWGPTAYPIVVGHEIVGEAIRVGRNVRNVQPGQFVGVGAQSGSCLECRQCRHDREPYCVKGQIGTYGGKYPDGSKSSGGYADYARVPSHFCIPLPDNVSGSELASLAPMMCGGVTVYSPLVQNNVGPGTRVGVVGIGGLGHFALMFAAAMGAEVAAISHSNSKEKDARAMGATDFIATSEPKIFRKHRRRFDLIICTTNQDDMPLAGYLSMLDVAGKLVVVGAPEKPVKLPVFSLLASNCNIGGSMIGSPKEIREMIQLAHKSKVRTWLKIWDMEQVNDALVDMENGNARYRHVLKTKWAKQ